MTRRVRCGTISFSKAACSECELTVKREFASERMLRRQLVLQGMEKLIRDRLPIPPAQPHEAGCSHCRNAADAAFCPFCGKRLKLTCPTCGGSRRTCAASRGAHCRRWRRTTDRGRELENIIERSVALATPSSRERTSPSSCRCKSRGRGEETGAVSADAQGGAGSVRAGLCPAGP